MNHDEVKGHLEEQRDHWRQLLGRVKKVNEAIPSVVRIIEMLDWEIEVLDSRPKEAYEIPLASPDTFAQQTKYLKNAFPMIPEITPEVVSSASASSTAGTANIFEFVSRVGKLPTRHAHDYSTQYTTTYIAIQESQDRAGAVHRLIRDLGNPDTDDRFTAATRAYYAAEIGTGGLSEAAFAMRTLLDGIKGDLFEKARRWPRENMTWEEMSARLARNGQGGLEYTELLAQDRKHQSLKSLLSDVGKGRVSSSITDLKNLWTQLLDHIYTVISLTTILIQWP